MPHVHRYVRVTDFETVTYEISSELTILGSLKSTELASPTVVARYHVVSVSDKADIDNDGNFCTLIVGSLKHDWYGYLTSVSDAKKSSLLLNCLIPGEPNYVIIIDAGSSGSRLFIYRCYVPKLGELLAVQPVLDEKGQNVVKKKEPGLSSFAENPSDVVEYVKDLLDYASEYIPSTKRKETSLFILATAGMRLLPEKKQDDILQELYNRLPSMYDFAMAKDSFQVISGKHEGLYAWISMNYVLGRLGPNRSQTKTAGIIDLGGGSVQIAFEVPQAQPYEQVYSHSLFEEVNLSYDGSSSHYKYRVYISTFLGYGANQANRLYEKWLSEQNTSRSTGPRTVNDCCLPKGMVINVSTVGLEHVRRRGAGCFYTCMNDLKRIITENVSCNEPRCSLQGIYQPAIDYNEMEFYGMSEYWFTSNDVFTLGTSYDRQKFLYSSSEYCSTNWSIIWRRFSRKLYPKADENRLRMQCFKSAWASVLLHTAFGFPENVSTFHPVYQIEGKEIQWTLGAVLHKMRHLPLKKDKNMPGCDTSIT
ncbi:unnamed protein product [Soboliphyme baturini]|uniref:IntS14_b-barrel domain-containing protein n=1 Tax=Soboliphyme baturini TaxID=241478 RepID=A0A183IKB7_9BILA|nr:unnamed protein product [Soboliphyme baturini]